MNSHKPTSWTSWPGVKLLLTACSFAGCTSGPTVSSGMPTTAVAPIETRASLDDSMANQRRVYAKNSIWAGIRRAEELPTDPFVTAAARSNVANAPLPQRHKVRAIVPASHGESDIPVVPSISPRDSMPGVVRVKDDRLPPAAPLGVSNPFGQQDPSLDRQSVRRDASRISAATVSASKPVPANLATMRTTDAPDDARPSISPVPIETHLRGRESISGVKHRRVQNDDMIVESNLLRKRAEWRDEVIPRPETSESVPFPIAPRRPFSAPEWEAPSPTIASANVPVELNPSSSTQFEQDAFPVAAFDANELVASEDTLDGRNTEGTSTADETLPPDPFDAAIDSLPATPESTSENGPQLVSNVGSATDVNPFSVPESITPPTEAPAPPVDLADAAGPLMIATSAPEKATSSWADSRETNRIVSPLELDEANRIVAEEAKAKPSQSTGTPLAIGLALAAIAVGAVSVRRRFSRGSH